MTTPPSRGQRKKRRTAEEVGEEVDVGGLEVEEVQEGSVVHGERGPRRGNSREIRGEGV